MMLWTLTSMRLLSLKLYRELCIGLDGIDRSDFVYA